MGVTFVGVSEFEDGLEALKLRMLAATEQAVADGAHLIQAAAMKHAAGRPGPNAVSGTLRRSIHVEGPTGEEGTYTARIGPSAIYARRIELGFMNMRDSLGRLYHQPPYPYMAPGLADADLEMNALFEERWGQALEEV